MKLVLVLLFLFLPSGVYANIYTLSLVSMIANPLDWPGLANLLVIVIPLILIISLVETLAVNKKRIKGSFGFVFRKLCLINTMSFFCGALVPRANEIWGDLVFSFILTVLFESLLIGKYLGEQFDITSNGSALELSARMNAASYALIGLIAIGLVYGPYLGNEHPGILEKVYGKLILEPSSERAVVDLRKQQFIKGETFGTFYSAECYAVADDNSLICAIPADRNYIRSANKPITIDITRRWLSRNEWKSQVLGRVNSILQIRAISPNGYLILCKMNDSLVIYDWKRRVVRKLPRELQDIWHSSFSYDNSYLITNAYFKRHVPGRKNIIKNKMCLFNIKTGVMSILGNMQFFSSSPYQHKIVWRHHYDVVTVYDYDHNKRRNLKISELYSKYLTTDQIAISPDGKYLAYYCIVNPFTYRRDRDIRVINIQTGEAATVCKNKGTLDYANDLLWIK